MKNVLDKSGTWISYKGERLGQGRENARLLLRENADLRGRIEHDLRKVLGLITAPADERLKPEAEPPKPSVMAATAAARARPAR